MYGLNNAKLPLIKANLAAATAEFPHLLKKLLKLMFSVRDESCRDGRFVIVIPSGVGSFHSGS